MASIINHWINGELQPSTSERYGEVFNPATGEVSASVSMANSDDLNKAVEAASNAFESWSETSVTKRAQIFFKYKELIEANRDAHRVDHSRAWESDRRCCGLFTKRY